MNQSHGNVLAPLGKGAGEDFGYFKILIFASLSEQVFHHTYTFDFIFCHLEASLHCCIAVQSIVHHDDRDKVLNLVVSLEVAKVRWEARSIIEEEQLTASFRIDSMSLVL